MLPRIPKMWGFQTLGALFRSPYHRKDYSILGSVLGSLVYGNPDIRAQNRVYWNH